MDIKNVFLGLSAIVGLVTPFIAITSILKGEYKPHRTTVLIWLIITLLFVGTLFAQGDRIAIVLAIVQSICISTILILSVKYGVGGFSKINIIVFILAMVTLFIWQTTSNPTLALYMSILTDLIGVSPTLYKAYKTPFSEDAKIYAFDSTAGFFNVLALKSFIFSELAFPGYVFLINFICTLIIVFRKRILAESKLINKQGSEDS